MIQRMHEGFQGLPRKCTSAGISDGARYHHRDPDTRLILVGDASMAPYELMARDGSIYVHERSGQASLQRLEFLADTFRHSVWLNPVAPRMWSYTQTIQTINQIFPMFHLSLDGLEAAVSHLMAK